MPSLVDRLRQGFVAYGCSNLNSIKVEQPEEMNAYGAGLKAAINSMKSLNLKNEEILLRTKSFRFLLIFYNAYHKKDTFTS